MTAAVARKTRPVIADGVELTWDEYLVTPEVRFRYEIIDGVVHIMSPAPVAGHQMLLFHLAKRIDRVVEQGGLGIVMVAPVDILIRRRPKLKTRQPDVLFISTARLGSRSKQDLHELPYLDIVPNLAIELLSPDEQRRKLPGKLADYAEIGVDEVWVVNRHGRTIEVLVLRNGQYVRFGLYGAGDTIVSTVLPGLGLTVDAVFA